MGKEPRETSGRGLEEAPKLHDIAASAGFEHPGERGERGVHGLWRRMAGEKMPEQQAIEPVSYTHLDVYKRQS